jgi:hypothetical protein
MAAGIDQRRPHALAIGGLGEGGQTLVVFNMVGKGVSQRIKLLWFPC